MKDGVPSRVTVTVLVVPTWTTSTLAVGYSLLMTDATLEVSKIVKFRKYYI
jgi:hypothetical protein